MNFLQLLKKLVQEVHALKVAQAGNKGGVHEDNSDEDEVLEQNAPEEIKVCKIYL